jgi:preprotein translocase subunit SecB
MSYSYNPDFDYDKELSIDVDTNIDFDTDITLDVYKDVNVDVDVCTNVEGNSAFLVADVEAIGTDTFVEVDASVLAVEDQLSSVTLAGQAVVG